jgi:hypothetical protein
MFHSHGLDDQLQQTLISISKLLLYLLSHQPNSRAYIQMKQNFIKKTTDTKAHANTQVSNHQKVVEIAGLYLSGKRHFEASTEKCFDMVNTQTKDKPIL